MIEKPSTAEPPKDSEFGFLMRKIVAKEMGFLKPEHTKDLYKPTVCLQPGTVAEEMAADFFRRHRIQWTPVAVKRPDDFPKALLKSTCKCEVSEISQLETIINSVKNPSDFLIFPMRTSAATYDISAKPRYFIRMYNIDDVARAYLNDQLIKTVKYKDDSDWVEITSMLSGGKKYN